MLILTLSVTLMSQFGLPDPNDNVLEERIECGSISNRNARLLAAYLKRGSCIHAWLNYNVANHHQACVNPIVQGKARPGLNYGPTRIIYQRLNKGNYLCDYMSMVSG